VEGDKKTSYNSIFLALSPLKRVAGMIEL